jgi:hypothetical protein
MAFRAGPPRDSAAFWRDMATSAALICYEELQVVAAELPENFVVDSTDHVLVAGFSPSQKFIYKNLKSELVVSVSMPQGVTLENPEHVYNALPKLHSRVTYYTNSL